MFEMILKCSKVRELEGGGEGKGRGLGGVEGGRRKEAAHPIIL